MSFSTIPDRANANEALASWWNLLKISGVALENFLGSLTIVTQFTVVNNQSVAANITGLSFDGSVVRSFEADVQIYRNSTSTGATELASRVKLIGVYKTVAASWEMAIAHFTGDEIQDYGPSGLIFSITAGGQVQYISHNMGGTPATSKLKFRASAMGIES